MKRIISILLLLTICVFQMPLIATAEDYRGITLIDFVYRYTARADEMNLEMQIDPLYMKTGSFFSVTFDYAISVAKTDALQITNATYYFERAMTEDASKAYMGLMCFIAALDSPVSSDKLYSTIGQELMNRYSGIIDQVLASKEEKPVLIGDYHVFVSKLNGSVVVTAVLKK